MLECFRQSGGRKCIRGAGHDPPCVEPSPCKLGGECYCVPLCGTGKPPATAEMPEGWTVTRENQHEPLFGYRGWTVPLSELRALLATQGLSICTEAERKVMNACKAFGDGDFATAKGTLPDEHYLCHNAKEHALVLAIWEMNK